MSERLDGPGNCIPQAVSCGDLTVTIGEEAQLDLNRLFDSLGITPTLPNLDAIDSTTYCSALDSSAHKCLTGGTFVFPEQIGDRIITSEALATAINTTLHAVYYKDPQTYFDAVQTETTTSGAGVDQPTPFPIEVPPTPKVDLGFVPLCLASIAGVIGLGIAAKVGIDWWMEKFRKQQSDARATQIKTDQTTEGHKNRARRRATSQPGFHVDPENPNAVLTSEPIIKEGTPEYVEKAKDDWLEKERQRIRNAPIPKEITDTLETTTHLNAYGRPELDEGRIGYLHQINPETDHRGPDASFKGDLPEGHTPRPRGESGINSGMRTSDGSKESEGYRTGSSRPTLDDNPFLE